MPLPLVGESLRPDETVEALARRLRPRARQCPRCRTRDPRGYCIDTGLCWWCRFPRPG